MFLELATLFGLPAHALLVHAAVILVPVAALALVATGWRRSWRHAYAVPVALLGVAGSISAFLAKESGEPLEHAVRRVAGEQGIQARFGDHPEQGDTAMLFAMLFTLALVLYAVAALLQPRWQKLPAWAGPASYGLAVVVAIPAVITMVAAGHSGAALVWNDLGSFAAGR